MNNIKKINPLDLVRIAVETNANIDALRELMTLQREYEHEESKKAYNIAIADFKAEAINITKNKKVKIKTKTGGYIEYDQATLDHILEAVIPHMSNHGLTHNWAINQNGLITVTCKLSHKSGYSESVSFSANKDETGNKNLIQQQASTVTYLQRYTFLAVTGLAAKGQDDDGQSAGKIQGYQEGFQAGINLGKAWYEHKTVIEGVKDALKDNDLYKAAEILFSLDNKQLMSIRCAPTKGGIFSMEESNKMKGDEWEDAKLGGIKANPNVDRSL